MRSFFRGRGEINKSTVAWKAEGNNFSVQLFTKKIFFSSYGNDVRAGNMKMCAAPRKFVGLMVGSVLDTVSWACFVKLPPSLKLHHRRSPIIQIVGAAQKTITSGTGDSVTRARRALLLSKVWH